MNNWGCGKAKLHPGTTGLTEAFQDAGPALSLARSICHIDQLWWTGVYSDTWASVLTLHPSPHHISTRVVCTKLWCACDSAFYGTSYCKAGPSPGPPSKCLQETVFRQLRFCYKQAEPLLAHLPPLCSLRKGTPSGRGPDGFYIWLGKWMEDGFQPLLRQTGTNLHSSPQNRKAHCTQDTRKWRLAKKSVLSFSFTINYTAYIHTAWSSACRCEAPFIHLFKI